MNKSSNPTIGHNKSTFLSKAIEHIDITSFDARPSIVDMDFFEALGFKHYQGSQFQNDNVLREHYIDRIYDTYIDEDQLQACDRRLAK